MAQRPLKSAWIGPALLAVLPLALLWHLDPVRAEADEGAVEITVVGRSLSLDARSVPLDLLLERLASALDFTVLVKCGAADCPIVRGRLRGALDDVLDWLLHGHGNSRVYDPATATGGPPKLQHLVVLSAEPGGPARAGASATSVKEFDAGIADLKRWASRPPRRHQAPLPGYRVTSAFGPRSDPLTGRSAWHQGVDLAAPPNTKVVSTAPGVVLSAGPHGGYGLMVEVDHGGGVTTRYAHLSEAQVTAGQAVAGGEPLGVIGATGRSTGRHLHFEVRIGGRPVDPVWFLENGRRVARLDPVAPLALPVVNGF